ncbi:hypothetical protein [Kribbella solani]|uniref:hypothetical protein n=1 Tax=Kribbella solani TaxID=236067 RepID=UPI001EE2F726|nr:hypothetical protein [Kribbella solani]
MGVGEVHPRRADLDQQLVRPGDRRIELGRDKYLGAAELGDLDRAHGGPSVRCRGTIVST